MKSSVNDEEEEPQKKDSNTSISSPENTTSATATATPEDVTSVTCGATNVSKDDEKPVEIEYDVGYNNIPVETDEDLEQRLRSEGNIGIGSNEMSSPMAMAQRQRGLSDREKVTEYKRWRTELMQKIPHQCTFADIEPDFCGEIEKFMIEMAEKKEEENKAEALANDDDDDNDDALTKRVAKKPKIDPVEVALKKSFSLKPVPSFYDQDRNRILRIHQHSLESQTRSFTEKKAALVINEYNEKLLKSNEIGSHQLKLRANLQKVIMWAQAQNNRQHSQRQYAMEVQMAKQRYEAYRSNLEVQQVAKRKQMENIAEKETKNQNLGNFVQLSVGATLMSIVDSIEIRSGQNPARDASRQSMLGPTLMNAVNGVIRTATRNGTHPDTPYLLFSAKNLEPYMVPKFVPPSMPRELINNQPNNNAQVAQIEQRARQDYARISQMFQHSESDRVKAWQKLLKVKAEFEPTDVRRRVVLSQPLPPVKSAPLPMNLSAHYPDHMYSAPPPKFSASSHSKMKQNLSYSMKDKKAKIFSDGSIAPIEQPKRGEDGLFVRPSGRSRKDLKWDATRGRWVPSSSA